LKHKKVRIGLCLGQTLPRVICAPQIARVVVADAARWHFACHGISFRWGKEKAARKRLGV
jgi:hypothetical protein